MTTQQVKAGWERAIEDTAAKAEAEVRRVIAYLNEEVVPEVRRDSSRALRAAAEELSKLADRMDRRRSDAPSPGSSESPSRSDSRP